MYASYMKRKASERVEATRLALVTGLWANSNFDGDGKSEPRTKALQDIEESSAAALKAIYAPAGSKLRNEIDKSDPFFAAMNVPEAPKEITPQDERRFEQEGVNLDQM